MSVNYELYKYFYYVAKYGSVSKAADFLEITQSALSQSIKQLECLVEKKLFVRTSKGMKLTFEGECLYTNVKTGVRYLKDAEAKLKYLDSKEKTITIATTPILAKNILFTKIKKIQEKFPNIKIVIKSFNGFEDRLNALRDGIADIAIVKDTKSFYCNEFEIKKIMKLNYNFFYNPNFFTIDEEITLEELQKLPLILKNEGSQTKNNFVKSFNLNISPFIECEHDDMIIELVNNGLGIGMAPQEYLKDTFKIINVKDYNLFTFNILCIYKKEDNQIKDFVKCLL